MILAEKGIILEKRHCTEVHWPGHSWEPEKQTSTLTVTVGSMLNSLFYEVGADLTDALCVVACVLPNFE